MFSNMTIGNPCAIHLHLNTTVVKYCLPLHISSIICGKNLDSLQSVHIAVLQCQLVCECPLEQQWHLLFFLSIQSHCKSVHFHWLNGKSMKILVMQELCISLAYGPRPGVLLAHMLSMVTGKCAAPNTVTWNGINKLN